MPLETQLNRTKQLEESAPTSIPNPAADPRKIRRVIAEDPEWNLETVPPLIDLCIEHIVANFQSNPLLHVLSPIYKQKVLEKLSPSVSLEVTSHLIEDENYWEKCCHHRWSICTPADHGGNWKRTFFEQHIQELIENFTPNVSDLQQLESNLKLSSPFIKCLRLKQLLPPPINQHFQMQEDDEGKDSLSEVEAMKARQDHIDLGIPLKQLHSLQELQVTYGVKNCGMNFDWGLFNFTDEDCQKLANAVKTSPYLKVLRICGSKVSDKKARLLIHNLLDHPGLETLDLSYNKLSNGAGRALGKLLNGHSVLHTLNITSNSIGSIGGISLGHALNVNTTLTHLNLRLNRLGDEGVQPILKALMKNATLVSLDLSSNDFGEATASILSEMLVLNQTLRELNITCNKLGEAGGKLLQEGIEENKSLIVLDLRLTEISAENEYTINQIIRNNADR